MEGKPTQIASKVPQSSSLTLNQLNPSRFLMSGMLNQTVDPSQNTHLSSFQSLQEFVMQADPRLRLPGGPR